MKFLARVFTAIVVLWELLGGYLSYVAVHKEKIFTPLENTFWEGAVIILTIVLSYSTVMMCESCLELTKK